MDRTGGNARRMILAAIDIGTNTVLLLVAHVDDAGTIHPLAYEQRIPRLGKGVDAARNLQPDAMQRVADVLVEYKAICKQYNADRLVVCGTSAVRDARNRDEFLALVREKTGLDVEILSGHEEAHWTYRGAISGVPGVRRATVVDIGGGSTEITVGTDREVVHALSLDIGSVRLTERFFKHDPPDDAELKQAIAYTEGQLSALPAGHVAGTTLIGVAGTVTSLAALAQGTKSFSIAAVANYRLTAETVNDLFRTLQSMRSEEIRELSPVLEGRSDVILAGTLILREIMEHFHFGEIIVSERGVRYGLVIREFEKMRNDQRTQAMGHEAIKE